MLLTQAPLYCIIYMPYRDQVPGGIKENAHLAQVQHFHLELGKDVDVKTYTLVQIKGLLFLFLWSLLLLIF